MNISESHKDTRYTWEWAIGLGVLMMIFGVIGIAAPFATSITLAWMIGALLLASGVAQLVHAIRFAKVPGRVGNFLYAVITLVAGALVFRNPIAGTIGITAIIAFYLIVGGIAKIMLSAEYPLHRGAMWVSAVLSIALGTILFVTFPTTSLFVPGLFFGIDLLFFGGSTIGFALEIRKLGHKLSVVEEKRKAG